MKTFFVNDGLLDLNCVRLQGVSVKETDSPIGYFGTGLKYAIAILLRTGHRVTIWINGTPYAFTVSEVNIRGKTFQQVCMDTEPLSFTLDYGKNWHVWQAYRELMSNALDEGGHVTHEFPDLICKTVIEVEGRELAEVAERHNDIFLTKPALAKTYYLNLHQNQPEQNGIFYNKVVVQREDTEYLFAYNFTKGITLTEDRTVLSSSLMRSRAALSIAELEGSGAYEIIVKIITAPAGTFEATLDFNFDLYSAPPNRLPHFLLAAADCRNHPDINSTALEYLKRAEEAASDPAPYQTRGGEQARLDATSDLIVSILGQCLPIVTYRKLPGATMSRVRGGELQVSSVIFFKDDAALASDLLLTSACHVSGAGRNSLELFDYITRKLIDITRELRVLESAQQDTGLEELLKKK